MSNDSASVIAANWPRFYRIWSIVAALLALSLLLLGVVLLSLRGNHADVPVTERMVENERIVEVERVVEVEKLVPTADKSAPVIELMGPASVNVAQGQAYIDSGVLAVDGVDGRVAYTTDGRVDSETPGEYELRYRAQDSAGNVATATRSVVVKARLEPDAPKADATVVEMSLETPAPADTADEAPVDAQALADTADEMPVDAQALADTADEMPVDAPTPTDTAEEVPDLPAPPTARVYFGFGSADLPPDPQASLADILDYLRAQPGTEVKVAGFHDPTGNKAYNIDLAQRRAVAVRKLLIADGVAEARILMEEPEESIGSGNHREARRVEVSVQ